MYKEYRSFDEKRAIFLCVCRQTLFDNKGENVYSRTTREYTEDL